MSSSNLLRLAVRVISFHKWTLFNVYTVQGKVITNRNQSHFIKRNFAFRRLFYHGPPLPRHNIICCYGIYGKTAAVLVIVIGFVYEFILDVTIMVLLLHLMADIKTTETFYWLCDGCVSSIDSLKLRCI